MNRFKASYRLFLSKARDHIFFLAMCLIVVQITNVLGLQSLSYSLPDRPLSLADGYMLLSSGYLFYFNLVFIPMAALSVMTRRDFTINYILKYHDRKHLWLHEITLGFLLVSFFVVVQFISTALWVLPKCDALINFDQRNSIFAFMNNGRTMNGDLSVIQFLIIAFIFVFMAGQMFSVLFVLLKWLGSNLFVPFLTLIFVALIDIGNIIGACTDWGVYYDKWLDFQPLNLIIPPIIAVGLCVFGDVISKRKEFLHAK